ncbi:MAG TPA: hypothetical protein VFF96_00405, partial [Pseudoxanthomonas sp.]|nr:hypothetical protein [Pseudoxanthomonas sp.]
MDDVAGLLALVGLAVLAMPVLLVVALMAVSGLKRRVATLEQQVEQLRATRVAEPASGRSAAQGAEAADYGPTLAELVREPAPAPGSVAAPAVSGHSA